MSEQIRFGLDRLRARNGFHEFEVLCLDFANATLGGHFVPATGPVGDGGDGGQDFVSHLRLIQKETEIAFADEVVGICTIRAGDLVTKIRSDLRAVAAAGHVTGVFAFLTADLPISRIQDLQREANAKHGIRLEVFDGNRLATAMARVDFAEIAYRRLNLDQRSLAAAVRSTDEARRWAEETTPGSFHPEFYDYLKAVMEASRQHPWSFVDQIPDLDELYQPQTLRTPNGSTCTWRQAVEQSEHVFVTGPAGSGKSSLLRHIATALSSRWLGNEAQPWVPVPVHAHDLAMGKSLTQTLHDGVERQLRSLLHRPLEADFFDREPLSGRWLVLVDGLDEVRDHDQRQTVLRVAEFATRMSSMRFVITSRPGGANKVPDPFTSYEVKPFNAANVRQFVERWLELRDRPSEAGARVTHSLTSLLDRTSWAPSPLVLLMICTLADNDSRQPLPETLDQIYAKFAEWLVSRLKSSGEPVIDDLQNQIHTLLEAAASHRLLEDPEAHLLDLAIKLAATRGITPPAPLAANWHRTVEEVLLRSGLITKLGGQLDFLHASFEEYYAVRAFPDPSPEDLVDILATQEASYDSVVDLVSVNLHLLELLLDRTDDADAAIAAIVEAYPSAVTVIVEHFEHYGLSERTADALKSVADDYYELDVQAQAAAALDDIEPGKGLQRRLALSIDLDMEDDDRLNVISGLVRHSSDVAAAIQWLTFETLDNTLDSAWKFQAAPLVTFAVSDEDRARGLQLLASNTELPEHHRIAACCDLAGYDQEQAYRLLRSFTQTRWLAMNLTDSRRESYAPTLLKRFVLDDTVAFTHRLDAIKYVEDDDPRWARTLYDALAHSPVLTDQQRDAVTSAVENHS
ncbi:NACHT domain-containing protein [Amycolatopsis sp. cmx-11-32]|uniref:NACHT domain-containing protein n=1 Tax=Amycolatopsis sp. cmx-11-32 TaxID=2785796 RepID=UPI0039E47DB2